MSERFSSGRRSSGNSRKTSASSNQLDSVYRDEFGRYIDDGFEVRPPSGTNHQQPGSHLSVDTRLSELNLGSDEYTLVSESSSYILRGSKPDSLDNNKSYRNKVEVSKPNCYVAAPFKQGPHKPKKGPHKVVDPSHDLKEATLVKIQKVRQQFRKPQPPKGQIGTYHRLRKARLKTTGRPISGSGPSINLCKGILAGPRVVRRTQRPTVYFREDLSRHASTRPESPSELLRASSSAHCTSVASSDTDYTEDCQSDLSDGVNNEIIDSWVQQAQYDDDLEDENIHYFEPDNNIIGDFNCDHLKNDNPHHIIGDINCDHLKNDFRSTRNGVQDEEAVVSDLSEKDNQSSSGSSKYQGKSQDDRHDIPTEEKSEQELTDNHDNLVNDRDGNKTSNGSCKPYNPDDENNHDDDDDNDDDDDKFHHDKRTSNHGYLRNNSVRTNSGGNKTGCSVEPSNQQGTKQTSQFSTDSEDYKMDKFGILGESVSLESLKSKKRQNSAKSQSSDASWAQESDTHLIGSCNGEDGLLMSVHVRKRDKELPKSATESGQYVERSSVSRPSSSVSLPDAAVHDCIKESHDRTSTSRPSSNGSRKETKESHSRGNIKSRPSSSVRFATHEEDEDFLDTDSVDSDCIPAEDIWRNLDTLNLSMSAIDRGDDKRETFVSKSRKVQSAGPRRKDLSNISGSAHNENVVRPSSAKQRTDRRAEKPDKEEILRKYLSQEGERFAESLRANLPGYFTEQYNILQRNEARDPEAAGFPGDDSLKSNLDKALVKFEGEHNSCDDPLEPDDPISGQTRPFPSMEPIGDPSSGVFFTTDTKTNSAFGDVTSGVETMSQLTDATGEVGDWHGDTDAGFDEDMPGTGSAGDQPSGDNLLDGKRHLLKNFEYRQSQLFGSDEDLEVIAKAKQLNETRCNQRQLPAPNPPVSFTINAIPPPGHLYYFAYGVDMNINRMSIYLRREHKRLWGILFGFQLVFNKKGSSRDAGGFPNVEYSPGYSVEGCVYTLSDAELAMLDNCMGYPKHYTRAVLPVWMTNSYQPTQLGVAQYCVPAVVYVAEQDWVETESNVSLDCSYSLGQCLKAADILTPNYLDYLQQQVERTQGS